MKDITTGFGKNVPPLLKYVEIYFLALGLTQSDAEAFHKFYENRNWKYRGNLIQNWKKLAWNWIYIRSIDPTCLH